MVYKSFSIKYDSIDVINLILMLTENCIHDDVPKPKTADWIESNMVIVFNYQ